MCHVVPCQAMLGTRHGKTALAPMLRKMARGSEYEHTSLFVDRCFGIPRILPSRSELSLSAIRVWMVVGVKRERQIIFARFLILEKVSISGFFTHERSSIDNGASYWPKVTLS
jgi:hypothetical protein